MKQHWPFWGLAIGYGAAMMLPVLLSEGTFLDGLIYAVLARNLAAGAGSFWAPHYTPSVHDQWFEHPPLGLNIQSIFYRILGDGVWVEHVHSACIALACGLMIVVVWRVLVRDDERLRRVAWLPVLLWLLNPQVTWAYSNNMLEGTMTIFSLAAVGLLVRAGREDRWLPSAAGAGAALVAAGLTKGVTGLFPAATLVALQMAGAGPGWSRAVRRTAAAVGVAALLAALVLSIPAARHNLSQYADTQFLASLGGRRGDTGNRFVYLSKLLNTLLPAIGLMLVLHGVAWRRRITRSPRHLRRGAGLLLLALAGSVPLVLSPRQSMFYVLPSFPVYALALALPLAGPVEAMVAALRAGSTATRLWRVLAVVVLAGAVGYGVSRIGTVNRSRELVADVKLIGAHVREAEGLSGGDEYVVGATRRLWKDWGLDANLARYHRFGIARDDSTLAWVVATDREAGRMAERYDEVPLATTIYRLHRLRSARDGR